MQDAKVFIGVDVAKAELVIATEAAPAQLKLRNERGPIAKWLRTLPAGACIAMESTGRYHQLLACLAIEAEMQVFVLNARDVHYYAKALGVRGKTDATDAQVIVRYLAEHHAKLHPFCPGTAEQQRLNELLRRRAVLGRHFGAIDESLRDVVELSKLRAGMARRADKLLAAIDAKIQALIEADPFMRTKREQLRTIPGVGPQVSALLTALLSRVPFANVDGLVAYSGLDPRPNDSGKKVGRRVLSKRGPAAMRRLLWLAAFSASHSKVFTPLYQSLKSRGFSGTEALVILARKLLRVAWAVWRTGQPFDPAKARQSA